MSEYRYGAFQMPAAGLDGIARGGQYWLSNDFDLNDSGTWDGIAIDPDGRIVGVGNVGITGWNNGVKSFQIGLDGRIQLLGTGMTGNDPGLLIGNPATGTGWAMNASGLGSWAGGFSLHAFALTDGIAWQRDEGSGISPIDDTFVLDLGDVVLGAFNYLVDESGAYCGGLFWDQSEKTLLIHGDMDRVESINVTLSGRVFIDTSEAGAGLIVGDYDTGTGWAMNSGGLGGWVAGFSLHAFALSNGIEWQQESNDDIAPIDANFVIDVGDAIIGAYNYKWVATGLPLGGIFWDNSAGKFFLRGEIDAESTIGPGGTALGNVWTDQNDGAESGLDADLLDGQEGTYYLDLANCTGVLDGSQGGTGTDNTGATLSITGAASISGDNTGDQDLSDFVVGPESSVDQRIPVFSGVSGLLLADSGVLITDLNAALTFQDGLTKAVDVVSNDLITGKLGGQTIIGGTAVTDGLTFQVTTGIAEAGADFVFLSGDDGAAELLRIYHDGKVEPAGNIIPKTDALDLGEDLHRWDAFISTLNHSGGSLGFFGTVPVTVQTLAEYVADDESSVYTGIDNTEAGEVYASLTDINALRSAYETLRAAYEDMRTKVQNYGLC